MLSTMATCSTRTRIKKKNKLGAPHFDKQKEGGVRSTLLTFWNRWESRNHSKEHRTVLQSSKAKWLYMLDDICWTWLTCTSEWCFQRASLLWYIWIVNRSPAVFVLQWLFFYYDLLTQLWPAHSNFFVLSHRIWLWNVRMQVPPVQVSSD